VRKVALSLGFLFRKLYKEQKTKQLARVKTGTKNTQNAPRNLSICNYWYNKKVADTTLRQSQ
jgi:hypothetical protein